MFILVLVRLVIMYANTIIIPSSQAVHWLGAALSGALLVSIGIEASKTIVGGDGADVFRPRVYGDGDQHSRHGGPEEHRAAAREAGRGGACAHGDVDADQLRGRARSGWLGGSRWRW